jgi:hypothetical protein
MIWLAVLGSSSDGSHHRATELATKCEQAEDLSIIRLFDFYL